MCSHAFLVTIRSPLGDDDGTSRRMLGSLIYIYITYAPVTRTVTALLHGFAEMRGLACWLMYRHSYCIGRIVAKGRRCHDNMDALGINDGTQRFGITITRFKVEKSKRVLWQLYRSAGDAKYFIYNCEVHTRPRIYSKDRSQ